MAVHLPPEGPLDVYTSGEVNAAINAALHNNGIETVLTPHAEPDDEDKIPGTEFTVGQVWGQTSQGLPTGSVLA